MESKQRVREWKRVGARNIKLINCLRDLLVVVQFKLLITLLPLERLSIRQMEFLRDCEKSTLRQ